METEPLIVSLIGVPSSGKSYYLAAMTWQLRNQLPKQFRLSFGDMDPESNQTIRDYETTLFLSADRSQFVGIGKTDMAGDVTYCEVRISDQPVRLPRPLLFTLRPSTEHPRRADSELLSQALCLYDNAGEHFLPGADTTLAPGTQHVARSRVLFFLCDPTQDTRFRVRCQSISKDPQLYGWARTQLQSTILTETTVRVRQYAGLPPNRRLDKPLVVLVAKSDIWAPLIGEDFGTEPCLAPRFPGGLAVLDVRRIQDVSRKVRTLLLDLTPDLVAAAEDCSETVVYVPVSALGRSPEPQEQSSMLLIRSGDIAPRWVTVPILYSIAMWSRDPLIGR
jgi:hypothetical protein